MNVSIKFQNHFKLYVLLKDKIIFESILAKNNIEFFVDIETQAILTNEIRYFLLDTDRTKIDKLLQENEIIANTETIKVADFRDGKKSMKLYLIFASIVVAIMILIDYIF